MKYDGLIPELTKPLVKTAKHEPNGHWLFPETMGNGVGFVYVIYDTVLNRAYLGKKMYRGMGKLNKGKESNWRKYASSSNLLDTMLKERPKEEFEFICLEEYKTKGTLSYSETWSLCLVEAPTTKEWYNQRIEAVSWSVKEPVTARHKARLQVLIDRIKNARV